MLVLRWSIIAGIFRLWLVYKPKKRKSSSDKKRSILSSYKPCHVHLRTAILSMTWAGLAGAEIMLGYCTRKQSCELNESHLALALCNFPLQFNSLVFFLVLKLGHVRLCLELRLDMAGTFLQLSIWDILMGDGNEFRPSVKNSSI